MPMVRAMPAIPGRVSVAPSIVKQAIMIAMLKNNAMSAKIPKRP